MNIFDMICGVSNVMFYLFFCLFLSVALCYERSSYKLLSKINIIIFKVSFMILASVYYKMYLVY